MDNYVTFVKVQKNIDMCIKVLVLSINVPLNLYVGVTWFNGEIITHVYIVLLLRNRWSRNSITRPVLSLGGSGTWNYKQVGLSVRF